MQTRPTSAPAQTKPTSATAQTKSASAAAQPKPKFTNAQVANQIKQIKFLFEEGLLTDEFYDRITEAAVRSGMAAEVSSAGWRKPVGEEYPAPPLLRRFVEQGVPLTTASDAHALPDVADRADDMRGLLVAAGVDTLRGFRQRQPHEIAISPAPELPVEPHGHGA